MDITLLYLQGCPNWQHADERLALIAAERPGVTVTHQAVQTPAEAERSGFLGSPSIQVEGVDLFAQPGSRVRLSCRRYPTPEGHEAAPTLEQLRLLADA